MCLVSLTLFDLIYAKLNTISGIQNINVDFNGLRVQCNLTYRWYVFNYIQWLESIFFTYSNHIIFNWMHVEYKLRFIFTTVDTHKYCVYFWFTLQKKIDKLKDKWNCN